MSFTPQPSSVLDSSTRTSVNINGTTFNVWDESRSETFAHAGSSTQKAVWVCRSLWPDRLAISSALLGGSTNIAGTTIYENGWPYPDNPVWLAQNIQTEGDGMRVPGPSGILDFQRAKLTVTFGIPEFSFGSPLEIGDDELEFSTDSYNLPTMSPVIEYTDGTACEQGMVRTIDIATIGYTRSRYNMAFLPLTAIRACINRANSAPIFGADVGTVIFKGGRSRRKVTPAGVRNWDLTFSFVEREVPWNNFVKPITGIFTPVRYVGTHDPVIKSADLNSLFTTISP
jgi:hypothetical protein